ncbi:50S ribosomal protein L17 [candidate division WOR-1 bacterium RIFOXYB2_FULL_42_35]|uniref:50S ribosomal protein L17 n=1 Tax=candidate division WOR-1 bacterium RIFOXYC2_FULL_41_25 TaxID=1802586 RepID=A0A1F4TM33_UNCSA|nr:MAG: 50S ribosomal protein L17 [candidate division WOR-1 bacterium RIFOXYA2_FULL_41_14]OGC23879.1 MAG: 50S ribosomal protein L17 [candidate division WOR-1 bacterium RIFOXYB2_FULL_42_35]OGC33754.1 MAG: 50S ribosomal protein L17 [candidate division WOR-1 bacterium RIFOXYC2_FULL_41_25]
MRHRKGNKKLGKPADQRVAMLKSIVRSLFIYGKIEVTLLRAKAARKMADKLITEVKKNTLFARRKVESVLAEKALVTKIFKTFPERFEGRSGGFTRMVKTRIRKGDAASMAMLELL